MSEERPARYTPWMVTIHWLTAILLVVVFGLGLSTRYLPAENWQLYVSWHMPLGLAVFLLMVIRIIVRSRSALPEPAATGNDILDKVGVATHHLLYVFAFLMPISGFLLAINYGMSPVQSDLIESLSWVPVLHRMIAPAFGLLILLHIGAAFYHQLIRRDNLLARMWYGD